MRFKQFYWPDTNVLVTRFLCPDGVGELQDFMPVAPAMPTSRADRLIRRIKVSRGEMEFPLRCEPAFDYARLPQVRADGTASSFAPTASPWSW